MLSLNHFSIRTNDLDRSLEFYQVVLGLTVGPRPAFSFPGVWMYSGDCKNYANAVVHLIGPNRQLAHDAKDQSGDVRHGQFEGSGAVDHVAFSAMGLREMINHLKLNNVCFSEKTVPDVNVHQVFLSDPQGITIELNYPASEVASLDPENLDHPQSVSTSLGLRGISFTGH